MKITKYVHSCLLVEVPGRVAIFDPGSMSKDSFEMDKLESLDDIFITHEHQDHYDLEFIKELLKKFPDTRITTTESLVKQLEEQGIKAQSTPPEGVEFFDAPHEHVEPLFPTPKEIGIHYLNVLTDPGDSHTFTETKEILAMPVTGPWGSAIKGLNLVLELKPKYVFPIHDWHWSDAARQQMYGAFEKTLAKEGIKFYQAENGVPVEINV
jgi:L-ascorbate metabolism protein UlaG (beta-lactamase superfamily)